MLGKTMAILSLSVVCVGCSTQNRADSITTQPTTTVANAYYGNSNQEAPVQNTVAPQVEDYYRARPMNSYQPVAANTTIYKPMAASTYNSIMQYHTY